MKITPVLLSAVEEEILSVPLNSLLEQIQLERREFYPNKEFYPNLGVGERAVLEFVLTQDKTSEMFCVLDDSKARNIAKKEGIPVVGSIGLMSIGYEICSINSKQKLNDILQNWRSKGFRMPPPVQLKSFILSLKKRKA